MPQTLVKVVTGVDSEGRTQVTAVQVKAFVHDAAGATAALVQLSKELDRMQATVRPASIDPAQLPNRPAFEEAMKMYRQAGELVRQGHAPSLTAPPTAVAVPTAEKTAADCAHLHTLRLGNEWKPTAGH